MRKIVTIATICVFALSMAPGLAWAISASFHFANASASGLQLRVDFKETGLGNTGFSSVNITVNANATANYECINGGSNHPKASNKETVSGPVTGGGAFPVSNGQTTGFILVSLPGPGSFSCPSGQNLVLTSGTFSGITISDTTVGDNNFPVTPSSISVP
jgi:hypothetical protein